MLNLVGPMLLSIPLLLTQDKPPEKILTLPRPAADYGPAIQISPDNRTLACPSKEGLVLWELPGGKQIGTIPVRAEGGFAFNPDGKSIVTENTPEGEVQVWSVNPLKFTRKATIPSRLISMTFTKDGSRMALQTLFGIFIISSNNLQVINKIDIESKTLKIHPDGKTLILIPTSETSDQVIYVDLKAGKPSLSPIRRGDLFEGVAISDDGAFLATASDPKKPKSHDLDLKIWDGKRGKEGRLLATGAFYAKELRFSANGQILGTIARGDSGPGSLRLWDQKLGVALWPEVTKRMLGDKFAFSPDGKMIGLVSSNEVTVWTLP